MLIMVAGPYSAPDAEGRAANLRRMNDAAGRLFSHPWMMAISLALAEHRDGCLHIANSPGADREAERIRTRGLPVWRDIAEIPPAD